MDTNVRNIGISGASGRLGSAILSELRIRANGERLIGISRTPENVRNADETRFGDYDAPTTLASAYAGLDRLLIIPSVELRPGRRGRQNAAAIDAAVAAGVRHIVLLSSVGIYDVAEPDLLASYYRAEQKLMRTAYAWTALRMTSFSEEFVREAQLSLPRGTIVGLGEWGVSYVSRSDVAAAAAGVLLSQGHDGAIYSLTGPESLSGPQRAHAVSVASGTDMRFIAVSRDAQIANLQAISLPEDVITAVISIQEHFAAGSFDIVTGDVKRLSGKDPRSLMEVLREALGKSQ